MTAVKPLENFLMQSETNWSNLKYQLKNENKNDTVFYVKMA
jgi:hypothetical protein